MKYANIGRRIVGALIDGLVLGIGGWLIRGFYALIVYGSFFGGGYAGLIGWIALSGVTSMLVFIGTVLYTVLMMGGEHHATLGQMAMGLSVVDANGNGIGYAKAFGRYFASFLSSILGIGYFLALFSDKGQTLHDTIAGTYVVEGVPQTVGGFGGAKGRVIGVRGEKAGMSFPVTGNGLMMGRDAAACQIVMKNSQGVSRIHCFVSYNPDSGMYIVSDRGSTYGTFTDAGVKITSSRSVALRPGERFYLGDRQNMFEVG